MIIQILKMDSNYSIKINEVLLKDVVGYRLTDCSDGDTELTILFKIKDGITEITSSSSSEVPS